MEDVIVHKQIVKIILSLNPKNHLKCPITIEPLENFHPFLYTCKKVCYVQYNRERKIRVLKIKFLSVLGEFEKLKIWNV